MQNQTLILLSIFLLAGCSSIKVYKSNNKQKELEIRKTVVSNCRNWSYFTLTDTLQFKVIQSIPSYMHGPSYLQTKEEITTMIIGVSKSDTIRILCNNIPKTYLRTGEIIQVFPLRKNKIVTENKPTAPKQDGTYLIEQEIPRFTPIVLTKNTNEDIYYCNVKKTTWANVIKKNK